MLGAVEATVDALSNESDAGGPERDADEASRSGGRLRATLHETVSDAVREGVVEAFEERDRRIQAEVEARPDDDATAAPDASDASDGAGGGRSTGRWLLALLGLGVAAAVVSRRRGSDVPTADADDTGTTTVTIDEDRPTSVDASED